MVTKVMIDLGRVGWRRRRIFIALFLLFCFLAPPASAQQTERARLLGKKLKCICGCNQVLTECNHVGCAYSHKMLAKLDELMARKESEDLTLQSFVQEYGTTVLNEPPATGSNVMVWILPILAPLAGLLVLKIVITRWRQANEATPQPVPSKWLEHARREGGSETDA